MENKVAKQTSETIIEKPIFIHIGLFYFLVRPITLAQIWELGGVVDDIHNIDPQEKIMPFAKLVEMHKDIELCAEASLVMIFRSSWKRKLWGWYIKRRIRSEHFVELINYTIQTFRPAFFLTSLISLKGISQMTTSTNTDFQTALGGSLEE